MDFSISFCFCFSPLIYTYISEEFSNFNNLVRNWRNLVRWCITLNMSTCCFLVWLTVESWHIFLQKVSHCKWCNVKVWIVLGRGELSWLPIQIWTCFCVIVPDAWYLFSNFYSNYYFKILIFMYLDILSSNFDFKSPCLWREELLAFNAS